MFTPSVIQSCLSALVGFSQNYHKDVDMLDQDLTSSLSGIYIDQSAHPLLTLENITAIADMFFTDEVKAYDSSRTYNIGDVVRVTDTIYESKTSDNEGNAPASSTDDWMVTNLLSTYLRRKRKAATLNLFNTVFTEKKLNEVGKTLLRDTSLYDGVGNLGRKTAKLSRFVGFIVTPKSKDITIDINQVGLQVDTVNPEFKLYVYHSSQNDYLQEIEINHNKAVSFGWNSLTSTLQLPFASDSINDGGRFYVGYYEDDLVGQAIWKDQTFNGSGCSTCNSSNASLYGLWGKHFSVEPFYVDNTYLDDDKKIFDQDKIITITNQNWGLNFRFQAVCDVSALMCRNKLVFSNSMKVQVVHDILSDMAYSVRDGQLKQKVQQMALMALNGDKNDYSQGVKKDLCDAVKTISFDMSDMSKTCLPCNTPSNVNITSVF